MAVAMIGPKFYAWDKNGKPLAFGKLYTYQARTNDPKDTYQSEDQIVPNTNPVILNGEGYANVYLSGSYKMVLKDKDENEIWSSDPVSAAQPSEWVNCLSATYLSSTSFKVNGNFFVEYEPDRRVRIDNNASEYVYATIKTSVFASGETTVTIDDPVITTGLVETCVSIVGPESIKYILSGEDGAENIGISGGRNLQQYIDDVVNVKNFGAKGDGVEDDTLSIQSAIQAASGKELFFPSGTYICSQVIIPKKTKLFGNSKESVTLKQKSGSNIDFIISENFDSIDSDGIEISGMKIDGNYFNGNWNDSSPVINNSSGNGIKIRGRGTKIDIVLENIAEVGFLLTRYFTV